MENRKYKRVKIHGNISGKMILTSNLDILDLSLSGIRFNSVRRVNINSICKIKIEKDDISINLKGIIVRSTFKNTTIIEGKSIPVYEVAMNFGPLKDEERRSLEYLIRRLDNE